MPLRKGIVYFKRADRCFLGAGQRLLWIPEAVERVLPVKFGQAEEGQREF